MSPSPTPRELTAQLFTAIERDRDEIIELLRDLVRIPTVNTGKMPTGNETAACRYLEQRLDGLESQTIESAPDRGSFIARLPGTQSNRTLLLMGHLDVVPPGDESLWTYPPFSGEVHEGRVHGRGAIDCKTMVAAGAALLLLLRREQIPLAGDLCLAATADEECGGHLGFRFLAREHPELLRADLAINEGGGRPASSPDGEQKFLIGVGEKGRVEVTICAKGTSTHAAMPWGAVNPLAISAEIVRRIVDHQPTPRTTAPIFQHFQELFGIDEQPTPENLERLLAIVAQADPKLAKMLRALSRMTLVPTMIRGGEKSNSIPDSCEVVCDSRLLPGQTVAELRELVDELLAGFEGVEYTIEDTCHPSRTDFAEEHRGLLERALAAALGEERVSCLPFYCTGFTDSHNTRGLDVPTYGFQPTHPVSDPRLAGIHCVNESASIDDLIFLTKSLGALAVEFLA
ncbi:M20 family metallopeptidase [Candidatus Sumerlaeota bacterium]